MTLVTLQKILLEELTVLDNAMYFVNSQLISLKWIVLEQRPTEEDIRGLNEAISKWIKKVRELQNLLKDDVEDELKGIE